MALINLECPICEFIFEAEIDDEQQARCFCCAHLFSPSPSAWNAQDQAHQHPTSLPKRFDIAEQKSTAIGKSDEVHSSILLKRIKARRRGNLILAILFLAAVASVTLVCYRYLNLEQQRERSFSDAIFLETNADDGVLKLTNPPKTKAKNVAVGPIFSSSGKQSTADVAAQATDPPDGDPLDVDPPDVDPPEFRFLSPAIGRDQAAAMKPYQVLLEIESPTGITYATGTIVDSRGYVVTSLPAVAGATRINASSAQSVAQIKNGVRAPLSDKVRGVISVSRAGQWVLLRINRRLVLNAADVSIPEADRLVTRQPLFRIVAPRSSLDFPVSEMRVDDRKKSGELNAEQRKLLGVAQPESQAIKSGKEVNWILSPYSPYDRLGAALVSPEGDLMAVLVNHDDQLSYFITASAIAARLKEGNFTPMPLNSL